MTLPKLNQKIKTKYKTIADAILVVHGFWAGLIAVSIPLNFLIDWFRNLSLTLVGINIISWHIWKRCPLNLWEHKLRKKYDSIKADMVGFPSVQLKKYFNIEVPPNLVKYFMYSYALVLIIFVLV